MLVTIKNNRGTTTVSSNPLYIPLFRQSQSRPSLLISGIASSSKRTVYLSSEMRMPPAPNDAGRKCVGGDWQRFMPESRSFGEVRVLSCRAE